MPGGGHTLHPGPFHSRQCLMIKIAFWSQSTSISYGLMSLCPFTIYPESLSCLTISKYTWVQF